MDSPILIPKTCFNHQERFLGNDASSDQASPCSLAVSALNTDISSPSATPTTFQVIKLKINSNFGLRHFELQQKELHSEKGSFKKNDPRKERTNLNQSSNISISIRSNNENSQERYANSLAKSIIAHYFIGLCFNILINILGILSELKVTHYSWFLFVFQGLLMGILVRKIFKSKFRSLNFRDKVAITIQILDLICYLLYFTFVLLRIYGLNDSLHLTIIPIWCAVLLLLFAYFQWLCSLPYANICWSLVEVASWSQLVLVSLKVEKIEISWFCALSVWLFVASLFGLFTLCCFIIWIFRNIKRFYHFSSLGNTKIVINLWYRLSSLLSIIFAVLIFSVSRQLDSNEIIPLKMVFMIGAAYSVLLLIFTIVFKRTLIKEISEIIFAVKGREVQQKRQKIFDLEEPAFQYLKKMSSTYFSPVLNNESLKNTTKEELKKALIKAQEIKSHLLKNKRVYIISRSAKDYEISSRDIRPKINSSFIVSSCDQHDVLANKDIKLRSYSWDDIESHCTSKKLVEEIKKSEEDKCLLCLDKEPNAVIMECGHGGICYRCAIKIWKKSNQCHLCRRKVLSVLRIKQLFDSANFKVKNKIVKSKPRIEKSWLKEFFI